MNKNPTGGNRKYKGSLVVDYFPRTVTGSSIFSKGSGTVSQWLNQDLVKSPNIPRFSQPFSLAGSCLQSETSCQPFILLNDHSIIDFHGDVHTAPTIRTGAGDCNICVFFFVSDYWHCKNHMIPLPRDRASDAVQKCPLFLCQRTIAFEILLQFLLEYNRVHVAS